MSARDAGRYVGTRVITLGWYVLAITGASSWDHDPNSWFLIIIRLGAAALFLWAAVTRSIRHYHEDHPSGGDES